MRKSKESEEFNSLERIQFIDDGWFDFALCLQRRQWAVGVVGCWQLLVASLVVGLFTKTYHTPLTLVTNDIYFMNFIQHQNLTA